MSTLAPPFLIGSSFLQVMSKTIKSGIDSKFGKIQSGTVELAALESLKKPIDLKMR